MLEQVDALTESILDLITGALNKGAIMEEADEALMWARIALHDAMDAQDEGNDEPRVTH